MKLLALDTSTEWLSLALLNGDKVLSEKEKVGQKASQLVLPKIQQLLNASDLVLADLDGIVFGAGPGAFTGVRIACGVAQGLGFGANKPVVGVNVLEAMAEHAGVDKAIIAIDARMGEIYHAAYRRTESGWVADCEAGVYPPDQLPPITGQDWVGIGNAWAMYESSLNRQYCQNVVNILTDVTPEASAMIQLAKPIFASGKASQASEARPIYIRNRVALTTKEREQGMRL